MIETSYDPEADVLRIRFGPSDSKYDGADEVAPGIFVEFDAGGIAIGVEIISVSRRASNSQTYDAVKPAA